jgi:hypothetical protein
VSLPQKTKFDPQFQVTTRDGNATQVFRDYLSRLDALVAALTTGATVLTNAANDGAAAAAGVQVGQLYRNGSVIQVRIV